MSRSHAAENDIVFPHASGSFGRGLNLLQGDSAFSFRVCEIQDDRIAAEPLSQSAQEALDSSLESGALPNTLRYRFRCEVCGDTFSLYADTRTGEGGWAREGENRIEGEES